jgi:hypothetical protein
VIAGVSRDDGESLVADQRREKAIAGFSVCCGHRLLLSMDGLKRRRQAGG